MLLELIFVTEYFYGFFFWYFISRCNHTRRLGCLFIGAVLQTSSKNFLKKTILFFHEISTRHATSWYNLQDFLQYKNINWKYHVNAEKIYLLITRHQLRCKFRGDCLFRNSCYPNLEQRWTISCTVKIFTVISI